VPVAIKILEQSPQHLPVPSPYTDAALLYYLQSSHTDKSCRASFGLAAQMIQASFYTQLRTERQLGYVVMSGAYPVYDVPGLFFLVQSPVVGSAKLQQHFNAYLDNWLATLDQLDEQAFERHREALRVRLLEQPKNQWQQGERYWHDLQYGYQHFDSRQQIIRALDELQFEHWRQHMREHLSADKRAGLWLYSSGQLPGEVSLAPLNTAHGSYKTFP
jgi:secreted Zn-dependent insulinase-like peptidase